MISHIINAIEKSYIPDSIIRLGIRQLLKKRLKQEHQENVEKQADAYTAFINELNSSQIAINTDEANEQHYEVPAEFFINSLGTRLKYSCALWNTETDNLDSAEVAMLELYTQRAHFKDGQEILELGCGWGSLTLYLAQKYPNSHITAISNSHSQREFILKKANNLNLNNIDIKTIDINDFNIDKKFDRIISIEMFEHIRNYQTLFSSIANWLKTDGLLFIHVFCHRYLMYPFTDVGDDDWMARYFFSGGQMPAADTFLNFQEDIVLSKRWLVSGTHYEKTSNAWLSKMDANKSSIMPLFEQTYGLEAKVWFQRWRIFYMACAELFGYKHGNEWMVAHYLFSKR